MQTSTDLSTHIAWKNKSHLRNQRVLYFKATVQAFAYTAAIVLGAGALGLICGVLIRAMVR